MRRQAFCYGGKRYRTVGARGEGEIMACALRRIPGIYRYISVRCCNWKRVRKLAHPRRQRIMNSNTEFGLNEIFQ